MKSIFGLDEKLVAALSYVLGPLSGLFVLVAERENKYVRFHALQSILWFLFWWILLWVVLLVSGFLGGFPLIGWAFRLLLSPVRFLLGATIVLSKIFLFLRAFMGHEFKLPFVGDVAWSQVNK